ncbi:hypothetical protein LJC10_02080 [Selenomonadales bacterium OttesenSCG-928-I06]|nr:hypothetical protein [Selenomonadales bacterium OttesenSCG-928-I06]
MEKYLIFILIAMPGFVSCMVARCLGEFCTKRSVFNTIMVYVAHSFFAIVTPLLVITLACFLLSFCFDFYFPRTWTGISNILTPLVTLFLLTFMGLWSAVMGYMWQFHIKGKIVDFLNNKTAKKHSFIVFPTGSLLFSLFKESEKPCFLVVKKQKEIVSQGFIEAMSEPESDNIELLLKCNKEHFEWFESVKNDIERGDRIINTYIDITNDFLIENIKYPEDWQVENS